MNETIEEARAFDRAKAGFVGQGLPEREAVKAAYGVVVPDTRSTPISESKPPARRPSFGRKTVAYEAITASESRTLYGCTAEEFQACVDAGKFQRVGTHKRKPTYESAVVAKRFRKPVAHPVEVAELRGKARECTGCGYVFIPERRQIVCSSCKAANSATSSQCPICFDFYDTHGASSPANVEVRKWHASGRCHTPRRTGPKLWVTCRRCTAECIPSDDSGRCIDCHTVGKLSALHG